MECNLSTLGGGEMAHQKAANLMFRLILPVAKVPRLFLEVQFIQRLGYGKAFTKTVMGKSLYKNWAYKKTWVGKSLHKVLGRGKHIQRLGWGKSYK